MVSFDDFQTFKSNLIQTRIGAVTIEGESMQPLYKRGQQLFIEIVNSCDQLKPFDIIVFWQNDSYTCHYVWSKNKFFHDNHEDPTFITRPLNPIGRFDRPIKFSQVLGRVTNGKIPFYLKIKIFFFTWLGSRLKT